MKDLDSLGLRLKDGTLWVLDQQRLPGEEKWLRADTPSDMIDFIHGLKIRGAPLIGVGAALALGLFKARGATEAEFHTACEEMRTARPTAVNLMHAVDRVRAARDPLACAVGLFEEDAALCDALGKHGTTLVADGDRILTHCNSGGLATAGIGTALGVLRTAHAQGKRIHVYVDETRPLLQGARLTAWELQKFGIPHTLICDNVAAFLMAQGKVDRVFLGADRIARNGDFANKIGTYGVAVAAHHHAVPFYPVAPMTTVDPHCATGADIPIEQRSPKEVRGLSGSFGTFEWAPGTAATYNPAFDVTPARLITALVLDRGVISPAELSSRLPL